MRSYPRRSSARSMPQMASATAPNLVGLKEVYDPLQLPVLPPHPEPLIGPEDAQVGRRAACLQFAVGQTPMDAIPRVLGRFHPPSERRALYWLSRHSMKAITSAFVCGRW